MNLTPSFAPLNMYGSLAPPPPPPPPEHIASAFLLSFSLAGRTAGTRSARPPFPPLPLPTSHPSLPAFCPACPQLLKQEGQEGGLPGGPACYLSARAYLPVLPWRAKEKEQAGRTPR